MIANILSINLAYLRTYSCYVVLFVAKVIEDRAVIRASQKSVQVCTIEVFYFVK